MIGHRFGDLDPGPLHHQHDVRVFQTVAPHEGEGSTGEPGQLLHPLPRQLGHMIPEEELASEPSSGLLRGAPHSARGHRPVRIEPAEQSRAVVAEQDPLGFGRARDRFVGVAQVGPQGLLVGQAQPFHGASVRRHQGGHQRPLGHPARNQAQVQGFLPGGGEHLDAAAVGHTVVAAVSGICVGHVDHQGHQPLGGGAQCLVSTRQLVTAHEGGASEPRQGHACRQRDALARTRSDLFLHGPSEGISSCRAGRSIQAASPGCRRRDTGAVYDARTDQRLDRAQRGLHRHHDLVTPVGCGGRLLLGTPPQAT